MNHTEAELTELYSALPLQVGAYVWCDVQGMTHGRIRSIDAEGFAVVALVGGCGDIRVPLEDLRRACGRCDDCRSLAQRPRCTIRQRPR